MRSQRDVEEGVSFEISAVIMATPAATILPVGTLPELAHRLGRAFDTYSAPILCGA
jgi:hypothetical protein